MSGKKTYEISETYKGEIHRIDSVVQSLAIEFQHTLEVSINEMESRYLAHKALGYTPYLVLDFTNYSAGETLLKIKNFSAKKIQSYLFDFSRNEMVLGFLKKIRKWFESQYYINGNLFIDFADQIIRFTPQLSVKFIKIEKLYFLNSLLFLEKLVVDERNKEKALFELKIQQDQIELDNKMDQWLLRRDLKIYQNKKEIENDKDFEYYRRCLQNNIIRKALEDLYSVDYVGYKSYFMKENDIFKKYHIYSIFRCSGSAPEIEIQYVTNSKVEGKKFEYLYTEINMIKAIDNGLRRFTFILNQRNIMLLTSKRFEFVKGILHSTSHPALLTFDENGKLISKEYFLFNVNVKKEEFDVLAEYYELNHYTSNEKWNELEALRKKINDEDKFDFAKYFYQRDTPKHVLELYYESLKEAQPLKERNDW